MGSSVGLPLRYGAGRALRNLAFVAALSLCALPALAQEVTIAALGDSLTAGYGLPLEDGFVPQLQAWLQARGHDVVIVNAGVSGDTTAGGLARVGWTLTPEIDAMIVALGGNDLLRGLPPELSRDNLAGILQAAQAQGLPVLLAGLEAPLNYGADYKAEFEAIYPDLAREYDAVLVPDFLQALRAAREDGVALNTLMQADGIHPTADGVARVVAAIGPEVERLIARTD